MYKSVLLFFSAVLLSSCGERFDLFEDYDDFEPRVETVAITPIGENTYKFTGRITHRGEGGLIMLGFSYDSVSAPGTETEVQINTVNGDEFEYIFSPYAEYEKIYLSTFVVNEWGYGYGNKISYIAPPVQKPEVPCNLQENTLFAGGFNYPVYEVHHEQFSSTGYKVSGHSHSDVKVELYFRQKPRNGVYTVTTSSPSSGKEVQGYFTAGMTLDPMPLSKDAKVYAVDSAGKTSVILCDGQYTYGTSKFDLRFHFVLE